jgi:hypothetical protein
LDIALALLERLQKQLKGSLSYCKIDKKHVVWSAAQFEGLGLNDHVVILFYGTLTEKQYGRAKEKSKIRTEKIISAIKWLIKNNAQWKQHGDGYNDIVKQIKNPGLLNNATIVEDKVEDSEHHADQLADTFQVFYSDGSVSITTGGQDDINEFQQIVCDAAEHKYQIEY